MRNRSSIAAAVAAEIVRRGSGLKRGRRGSGLIGVGLPGSFFAAAECSGLGSLPGDCGGLRGSLFNNPFCLLNVAAVECCPPTPTPSPLAVFFS